MTDEFTVRRALKTVKDLYDTLEEVDRTYTNALTYINANLDKIETTDLAELVHLISKEASLKKEIVKTTNKIIDKI